MSGIENLAIKFESEAAPPTALVCTKLVGEERLSTPFRFELELLSADPGFDLEGILYAPARLGLEGTAVGGEGRAFRWYHGALASLTLLEQEHGLVRYRAELVPDLQRLADYRRSRVFLDLTIDELIVAVLGADLSLERGQDFELKLGRTGQGDRKTRDVYPEREYVVQYDETDLAFLSRWLEREGIFYSFENDGTREQVVFADAASAYRPAAPGHRFRFRPKGGGDRVQTTGASEDVTALVCRQARAPGQTVVADWNWREPAAPVVARAKAEQARPGLLHEYNAHVRTPAQAKALAAVRREAHEARARVFEGRSTCRSFRPGRTFDLEGHFRPDFEGDYVVTAVRHEAEQAVNFEAGAVTSSNYENSFEALPRARAFRPERRTPWPAIHGVMHAKVDSAGDGAFADLDDQGRYLVRLPWDLAEAAAADGQAKPAGKASRRVRMVQPYGGPGVGMHFPLRKGTEVLLLHIDGDPDRPVITGAVPNTEAPSPVDLANHKQNRLHTTSGNAVVLDDDPALGGFVFVDMTGGHMRDLRQTSPEILSLPDLPLLPPLAPLPMPPPVGGGGGEAPPWTPPPPRPLSPALRRAIAGGRPLPPDLAARLDRARGAAGGPGAGPGAGPGGGAGGEADAVAAVGLKTTLGAYVAAWGSDAQDLLDTAIDRLTGFDQPAVFEDYKFVADKSDSTLTIEDHDSGILVKNGTTRYTLDNVSFTYNYSTSDGYTMNQAEGLQTEDAVHDGDSVKTEAQTGDSKETSEHTGDKDSKSTHIGNSVSLGMHVGNDQKTELSVGTSQSVSMRAGTDQSTSLLLGDKNELSLTLALTQAASVAIGGVQKFDLTLTAEETMSTVLGPKNEVSLNIGPKASFSLTLGPENESAINLAPKDEFSLRLAPTNTVNLFCAVKAEFDVVVGYEGALKLNLSQADELTVTVGIKNELGVFVGVQTETKLFLGGQMKIDISASLLFDLAIAAAAGIKIAISADGVKKITIPKEDEVALQKTVTVLQKQVSLLNFAVASLMETH